MPAGAQQVHVHLPPLPAARRAAAAEAAAATAEPPAAQTATEATPAPAAAPPAAVVRPARPATAAAETHEQRDQEREQAGTDGDRHELADQPAGGPGDAEPLRSRRARVGVAVVASPV